MANAPNPTLQADQPSVSPSLAPTTMHIMIATTMITTKEKGDDGVDSINDVNRGTQISVAAIGLVILCLFVICVICVVSEVKSRRRGTTPNKKSVQQRQNTKMKQYNDQTWTVRPPPRPHFPSIADEMEFNKAKKAPIHRILSASADIDIEAENKRKSIHDYILDVETGVQIENDQNQIEMNENKKKKISIVEAPKRGNGKNEVTMDDEVEEKAVFAPTVTDGGEDVINMNRISVDEYLSEAQKDELKRIQNETPGGGIGDGVTPGENNNASFDSSAAPPPAPADLYIPPPPKSPKTKARKVPKNANLDLLSGEEMGIGGENDMNEGNKEIVINLNSNAGSNITLDGVRKTDDGKLKSLLDDEITPSGPPPQ